MQAYYPQHPGEIMQLGCQKPFLNIIMLMQRKKISSLQH